MAPVDRRELVGYVSRPVAVGAARYGAVPDWDRVVAAGASVGVGVCGVAMVIVCPQSEWWPYLFGGTAVASIEGYRRALDVCGEDRAKLQAMARFIQEDATDVEFKLQKRMMEEHERREAAFVGAFAAFLKRLR